MLYILGCLRAKGQCANSLLCYWLMCGASAAGLLGTIRRYDLPRIATLVVLCARMDCLAALDGGNKNDGPSCCALCRHKPVKPATWQDVKGVSVLVGNYEESVKVSCR